MCLKINIFHFFFISSQLKIFPCRQPEFFDWAFNLERGAEILKKWEKIPPGIDILLSHSPPVGHGDFCVSGVRAGCVELLSTVQRRVKPKYHVFGHIHEGENLAIYSCIYYLCLATFARVRTWLFIHVFIICSCIYYLFMYSCIYYLFMYLLFIHVFIHVFTIYSCIYSCIIIYSCICSGPNWS